MPNLTTLFYSDLRLIVMPLAHMYIIIQVSCFFVTGYLCYVESIFDDPIGTLDFLVNGEYRFFFNGKR